MSPFSRGRPEGSLCNSYYSKMWGRALLLSLDCSTLSLIRTLYCWVLSKEISSTIFKGFGMMQPGIEPRSPGPLTNALPTRPLPETVSRYRREWIYAYIYMCRYVFLLVFFFLVFLFNGISTLVGYLMPKPFSLKNNSGAI